MADVSSINSTPSGLTGTGGGNMLRITGMATGLDVDGMVKKMMLAQQTKIDKAKQAQQIIKWKQEAYQDIIKDIKDFQSTYFDPLKSDTYILSANAYSAMEASGVDTNKLSISTGVGALAGAYTVSFTGPNAGDPAGQLAAQARISGTQLTGKTIYNKMSDLDATFTTGTKDLVLEYTGSPTGGSTITINSTDNINDVINKINTATGGRVTASFSELTGKFTLQSASTGADQTIKVTSGDAAGLLGLTSGQSDTGKNAIVYITEPGQTTATKVERSGNNFTIDGVSYNLTKAEDSSFTITQNADKVYSKISGFIDKYNGIIDKIQTELAEKKNLKYQPLTDSQKSQMKDSEIASWEANAKKGILRNDDNLEKMLSDLRSAFTTPVSNTSLSFGKYSETSIGIDTYSDINQGGKINIADKDKLMNAIRNNSSQLLNFFTATSTSIDPTTKFKEQGIMSRIKDIVQNNVGTIGTTLNNAILTKYANLQDDYSIVGAGLSGTNTLPNQIYYKQILINKLNDDYQTKQEAYYQQFSRLETAMNQLNSQQSWLSQHFGG